MKERIRTTPNLAASSPAHVKAIADGTDHFTSWTRNVIDEFKPLSQEEIKAKVKERAFPFAVLFENLIGDFNFASGIRNANAFGAKHVYYIGDKRFDKRGAQGSYNYMEISFLPTIDDLVELQKEYTFIGADNIEGSVPLDTYVYPTNPLILFGSEGVGLTPMARSMCKDIVHIKQYGSVRSLNVATSSGIFMNDIITKYNKIKGE